MRYVFLILIFIHAAIHFLGFLKAFELSEIEGLNINITPTYGWIWLCAGLLLTISAVLNMLKIKTWWMMAFAATVLSQYLIIAYWADAKYGTVPNIIILLIALTSAGSYYFHQKVNGEINELKPHFSLINQKQWDEDRFQKLPHPIKQWLIQSGAYGMKPIIGAHVNQDVLIKMKPGQKEWSHGRAKQIFTIYPPSFIWTINLAMNSFVEVTGRDKFYNGKGEMDIKLFSLFPLVKERPSPKINEAALQRYLSEMVWFPTAAMNESYEWTEIDDFSAKATLTIGNTKGTGTFFFDHHYRFLRFETMRYKEINQSAERLPWIITALDHRSMNGIIIPTQLTVEWEVNKKRWKWLEMKVTGIQYLGEISL